jgi:hypothetical protein
MAEMAYRIDRNKHYSGSNDDAIRKIEGVYRSLDHLERSVTDAGTFQLSNLPDGTMRLYDKDVTKEEIAADSTGQFAVARVELVR